MFTGIITTVCLHSPEEPSARRHEMNGCFMWHNVRMLFYVGVYVYCYVPITVLRGRCVQDSVVHISDCHTNGVCIWLTGI